MVLRPPAVRAALRNGPKRVAGRRWSCLVYHHTACLYSVYNIHPPATAHETKSHARNEPPTCYRRSLSTRRIAEIWETVGGRDHRRGSPGTEKRRLPKPRASYQLDSSSSSLLTVWDKNAVLGGAVGSVVVAQILLWSGRSCRGNTHSRFAKNFLARLLCTSFICGLNYISPPPFVLL